MNLEESTEYWFRVIAVNAEGQSPPLEADDVTKCIARIGNVFFFNVKMLGIYIFDKCFDLKLCFKILHINLTVNTIYENQYYIISCH